MKTAMKILCLALFVCMMSWSMCLADDEDSADNAPPPAFNSDDEATELKSKTNITIKINSDEELETPKPTPKPKSTVKNKAGDSSPPSSVTWDFETGNLTGWKATGTAFKFQPTYGDNPTARHRGQQSNHQGNFWIGTYENRPTHRHLAGQTQGDGPKGTLTSAPFKITCNTISFLVGGGCDLETVRIELLIDGAVVDRVTGKCTETMEADNFPVSKYIGKSAQIRLVDDSSGGWGHINVDDIKFEQ